MCKFKEIGGKNTFSSTNYFFLLRLCFFLSRPLFSISTSLLIHAQFFSPSATFSKPAPYSQSANFYCIFCWTARWSLKKTTLWLCFSAVILICVSFPLDCHCVLPNYLPALHLLTALLGELAILRHSRRSHVWKKVAVKWHEVAEVDSPSRPLLNGLRFLCKLPLTIFLEWHKPHEVINLVFFVQW